MKTIKDVIEESTALGKRLMAENPGMVSMSFEFDNFPVKDVKAAGEELLKTVTYSYVSQRFTFCASTSVAGVYIHIYSVKVKIREVIEEDEPVSV